MDLSRKRATSAHSLDRKPEGSCLSAAFRTIITTDCAPMFRLFQLKRDSVPSNVAYL